MKVKENRQLESLELELTDGCEPLTGCSDLNSSPLKEQGVSLTAEPSPQPQPLLLLLLFLLIHLNVSLEPILELSKGRMNNIGTHCYVPSKRKF